MNEHDLFDALSMIDPGFIEEAAYELKDKKETGEDPIVTDINKKLRIRKILYVALPSVAAILLIIGVAIPAIVRVTEKSSSSAATDSAPALNYEAPVAAGEDSAAADAMEEAAPEAMEETSPAAADEAASEAVADAEDNEEIIAEAPAADTTGGAVEEAEAPADNKQTLSNDKRSAKSDEAVAQATETAEAEEATQSSIEIKDTVYKNGELSFVIPDISGRDPSAIRYTVSRVYGGDKTTVITEGFLDDLIITDDRYFLDLSKQKPEKGTYKIEIEDTFAEFTVK